MTGTLRTVLRGLVPSKKKRSSLASFRNENLLFICNHDYKHYRFAYFKVVDAASRRVSNSGGTPHLRTAPLAAFGWGPDDPIRTLCEFNLNALEWPDGQPDAEGWVTAWSQAFDVEKVTRRFYEDYAAVFEKVEKLISRSGVPPLSGDDLRMFTQTLFNRLMFLRFMERKGWLTFDGRKDYLRAVYAAGGCGKKSFYKGRLCPLFFEGLVTEGKQRSEAYGCVPCLNGGLFERSELDKQVSDLPDDVFAGILADEHAGGLFYRYNFTVEESTPLDIEVAVDPEMLGKVFEELVTGRHESGSYYTPRPVVSFMCREALKGYLSDKTKAPSEAVAALVDRQDAGKLKETYAREILTALDNVKAVDPACGSGAYLLGLLQEMIVLYRLLYSEKLVKDSRTLYDLKLRIISQSLYGVDLDPFATNIAKLRLWLSLAVEADKPVALPNQDFKIETGDSLLAPDPQEMPDLFRGLLQASADVLAMVKNQFFLSHGDEKEGYRKTIQKEEARLRAELHDEYGNDAVDWRIQFAEAFASGRKGFDVVLANPPYVRAELIKDLKPALKKIYPEVYTGSADLYCYFYARAVQLLRRGGSLSYISSNKWLKAAYGEPLRQFLVKNTWVDSVVDFGHAKQIFPAADVFPCIIVARRPTGIPKPETTRLCVIPREQLRIDDLSRQVQHDGVELPLSQLTADAWQLEPRGVQSLLQKIRNKGVPLTEFAKTEPYRGILTGLNEAFLIDTATRKNLLDADPHCSKLIRRNARGQDFSRWNLDWAGFWLICIPSSENCSWPWSDAGSKAEAIFARSYPSLHAHFRPFRDRLVQRQDKGRFWWELRSCAYWSSFDRPKIMYPEITWRASWVLDPIPFN